MPQEIRPFDLGNTLARAAQINALRSRNEFSKLQIEELNKKRGQQEAITNAFASDDPLNSLLGLGESGLPAAKQVVDFQTSLANLEGKDLENVINTGRLVNDALNSALDSANPRQSVGLALKNPVLAKLFPKIDLDSVSDEELISSLESLRSETDLFNDPQEISRLISGQEAVDLGAAPGTLLQQKSQGGQVTGTSVLQGPQKSPGANERELRIQDFIRTLGVDRATAVKLDKGLARVETDDFGRARLVDEVTGTVQEINIQPASGNEPIPDPEQGLFELTEDATGPEATVKAGFAQMVSIAGGPVTSPEVIQARTSFAIATNDFIRALTLNKRFPVKEIERIREEINLKPKFFDSPELMQNRMIAIDRSLRERQRKALNNANNTQLPEDTRKNAAGSAQDIEDFLNVLNVPPSPKTQAEYDALKPGTVFIDTDGELVTKGG